MSIVSVPRKDCILFPLRESPKSFSPKVNTKCLTYLVFVLRYGRSFDYPKKMGWLSFQKHTLCWLHRKNDNSCGSIGNTIGSSGRMVRHICGRSKSLERSKGRKMGVRAQHDMDVNKTGSRNNMIMGANHILIMTNGMMCWINRIPGFAESKWMWKFWRFVIGTCATLGEWTSTTLIFRVCVLFVHWWTHQLGNRVFSYFSGAILSKCQQNEEIWLVNSKILSHRTIGHDISSTVDLYKVYESYKIWWDSLPTITSDVSPA